MPPATDALCRSYLDLRWHFDPAAATAAGSPDQDHRLGRFDPESMDDHLAAFRAMALAVEDLPVTELQDEIDRVALLDDIRSTDDRFRRERPHIHNPGFWLSHVFEALYGLLARPAAEADGARRARAALDRLKDVPAFFDAAEATLEEPAQIFLDAALDMVPGGLTLVRQTAEHFGERHPELADDLGTAADQASDALESFADLLRTDLEAHPDTMAFAVGEEEFERRLHHQHALRYSAPELWRYGLHLQDETTAAIEALARRIDPAASWRELVARYREDTPTAAGLLDAYREALDAARRFTAERDLVALPEGALEVVETPDFMRPLIPFAAYQPPGPLMTERTGMFYVTVPRPDAAEAERQAQLREHCRHEIRIVALHEAYPGHHLQMLTAQQCPSLVRRFLWTPVMVEGWALYCEDLLGREGFYRTDQERLFQLVLLLWRAVRVVLDVGLHTRGMRPEEAVHYLADHLPMEPSSAVAEVRRYCATPTYQLCYAVGRRQLLELSEDYRRRAGADMPLRRFHDELLGYGGLPVTLARWGMGLES